MLLDIFFVIVGFAALLLGGEFLVRGGVAAARKLGVRPLIIGLTWVAFGTSAPELMVSIQALLTGHADIVMGNAIGSNIANILLVIGFSALIIPISGASLRLRPQASFLLGFTFLFGCFFLGGMKTLGLRAPGGLSRGAGKVAFSDSRFRTFDSGICAPGACKVVFLLGG